MLIEFGMINFQSFKEGVTLSFKLPGFDKNPPKQRLSRLMGVKGANGSGKTALLKGLDFLAEFAVDSWNQKPEDKVDIDSFFYNKEPTEFFAEFLIDNATYRFELSLDENRVYREALYRKVKREVLLFEREGSKVTKYTKEFSSLKKIKLRDNASIISTSRQYEYNQLNDVYLFFKKFVSNVSYLGKQEHKPDMKFVSKFYFNNDDFFSFVKNIIISCDLGIEDIDIREFTGSDGEPYYAPVFHHSNKGVKRFLSIYCQSSGTKSLFLQLGRYKAVLDLGGILIFDEFDNELHPHILPYLLRLFDNEKNNSKNAQFVFSTHNSEVLDILGKYRTYLVNREDCESYAYRLDEIPNETLRNDRPIAPIYNQGKIGGVPRL